jgi:hypothetical protein
MSVLGNVSLADISAIGNPHKLTVLTDSIIIQDRRSGANIPTNTLSGLIAFCFNMACSMLSSICPPTKSVAPLVLMEKDKADMATKGWPVEPVTWPGPIEGVC